MTDNTPVLLRKIADAYKITAKKLYDQSYVEQRGGFADLSPHTLANSMVFQFLDEGIRSVLDTAEQPTPPEPVDSEVGTLDLMHDKDCRVGFQHACTCTTAGYPFWVRTFKGAITRCAAPKTCAKKSDLSRCDYPSCDCISWDERRIDPAPPAPETRARNGEEHLDFDDLVESHKVSQNSMTSSSTDSGIVERLRKCSQTYPRGDNMVPSIYAEAAAAITTLSSRIETLEKERNHALNNAVANKKLSIENYDAAEKAEAEAKRLRDMLDNLDTTIKAVSAELGGTLDKDFGLWSAPSNDSIRKPVYWAWSQLNALTLPRAALQEPSHG